MSFSVSHLYQNPALSTATLEKKCNALKSACPHVSSLEAEFCFNIEARDLTSNDWKILEWILEGTFNSKVHKESILRERGKGEKKKLLVEIGPRLNFSTPFSTNAVSICEASGIRKKVQRIERSTLYFISLQDMIDAETEKNLVALLHDRMTEQRYPEPLANFQLPISISDWSEVNIIGEGKNALERVNEELGLAFDEQDIQYYYSLFKEKLKRNPTTVECFDLAQSNSEHSRHWFFRGDLILNDKPLGETLFQMVTSTQNFSNANNVIKFSDNSSAIIGFSNLSILTPVSSREASQFKIRKGVTKHIIFTAETHNFPTGVAPFQGATTGTGGRIRDVQAVGRGGHVIAGTAGYSFGNLLLPGYDLPWESKEELYPANLASPADICIEASNGASDYGNKFGEPVIAGFCRSFGMRLPNGERKEWIKPIMFSGGIGTIDAELIRKNDPKEKMLVVKVGGPVYRIGVGGGAASSIDVQGDDKNVKLDYGAVQRGDPEMEQKLNRVIRACIEMSDGNPIQSIHDQGAGGNGNVLKELVEPLGAVIYTSRFSLGDPTINTLELWGAEYQESNAILVHPQDREILEKIGCREKCPIDFVGQVTGDGIVRLIENEEQQILKGKSNVNLPVNLSLEYVLGSMPSKKFHLKKEEPILKPLILPANLKIVEGLERVLRLPSVGSKRFLTSKVDRSVTGLVAQQQCVGPLQLPLADYAVTALNYYDLVGAATSIGEQPIKGLLSPGANGRMTVAEAITNLMFVRVTQLEDVKCSGNWMWPAKLPGEGAALVETCQAACKIMSQLGIAIDGGKDSLSMAAKVSGKDGKSEVVKSPGTLVISTYVPVPDIRVKVTPELRSFGYLIYINTSGWKGTSRTGGSALAQVFGQIGSECPDINDPLQLSSTFKAVQGMISSGICTAGHDVSDGGIIACILEMAFATNCGLQVQITRKGDTPVSYLFSEESGVVIEVKESRLPEAQAILRSLDHQVIGRGIKGNDDISITFNDTLVLKDSMRRLRDVWEETSFQLERRQANVQCVVQEEQGLKDRKSPEWKLTFDPNKSALRSIDVDVMEFRSRPRVAVIREEGINGDREMIASLYLAGFEVVDVMMTDLFGARDLSLDSFKGIVFPGGFSYADVLGSARGWAATLKFNDQLRKKLESFKNRSNTFSLGVCNGCQLLALLNWVGSSSDGSQGTVLAQNDSGRFESRFTSVLIEDSPSIMLQGMKGSNLGVWVAHGEGKFMFKNSEVFKELEANTLVALRYTDDSGHPTERYPMNPNGSQSGIAGICSRDGRHLALMPHPERCTLMWQWPWIPQSWRGEYKTSPWMKMFVNAYEWSLKV